MPSAPPPRWPASPSSDPSWAPWPTSPPPRRSSWVGSWASESWPSAAMFWIEEGDVAAGLHPPRSGQHRRFGELRLLRFAAAARRTTRGDGPGFHRWLCARVSRRRTAPGPQPGLDQFPGAASACPPATTSPPPERTPAGPPRLPLGGRMVGALLDPPLPARARARAPRRLGERSRNAARSPSPGIGSAPPFATCAHTGRRS